MLDLDNFKAYNDTDGHPAGDILLSQMGKIVKGSVRNVDQAFRYGGDEFAVLLPHTNVGAALEVAERLRRRIASALGTVGVPITASLGLATWPIDGLLVDIHLRNSNRYQELYLLQNLRRFQREYHDHLFLDWIGR